jgi:hypothetical protein
LFFESRTNREIGYYSAISNKGLLWPKAQEWERDNMDALLLPISAPF